MNNLRVLDNVKIKGKTVSVDLERGGSGLLNIHTKIDGVKYHYYPGDDLNYYLQTLPKSVRKNKQVVNALDKAVKRIKGGW